MLVRTGSMWVLTFGFEKKLQLFSNHEVKTHNHKKICLNTYPRDWARPLEARTFPDFVLRTYSPSFSARGMALRRSRTSSATRGTKVTGPKTIQWSPARRRTWTQAMRSVRAAEQKNEGWGKRGRLSHHNKKRGKRKEEESGWGKESTI